MMVFDARAALQPGPRVSLDIWIQTPLLQRVKNLVLDRP